MEYKHQKLSGSEDSSIVNNRISFSSLPAEIHAQIFEFCDSSTRASLLKLRRETSFHSHPFWVEPLNATLFRSIILNEFSPSLESPFRFETGSGRLKTSVQHIPKLAQYKNYIKEVVLESLSSMSNTKVYNEAHKVETFLRELPHLSKLSLQCVYGVSVNNPPNVLHVTLPKYVEISELLDNINCSVIKVLKINDRECREDPNFNENGSINDDDDQDDSATTEEEVRKNYGFAQEFPELRDFCMDIYGFATLDCQNFIAPKLEEFHFFSDEPTCIINLSSELYPNLEQLSLSSRLSPSYQDCASIDFSKTKGFQNLKHIRFSKIKIDNLIFGYWLALETLSIVDSAPSLKIGSDFQKLKNLKKIAIIKCQIDEFPDDLHLENLEELRLNNCRLSHLSGLKNCLNLVLLSAEQNSIENFTTNLTNHSKLKVLNLWANKLQSFENIHSIPNLVSLDIRSNLLKSIDKPLLLPKLRELFISDNPIKKLDANIASLVSLQILEAEFCAIEKISTDFSEIKSLAKLSFESVKGKGKNSIFSIKHFADMSSLESLNLQGVGLVEFDCQLFHRLISLNLSKNKITVLRNLESLINLRQLNVSYNSITCIKTNFAHLKNLSELDLGNNRLSSFENINDIPNLEALNLDSNCLREISPPLNYPNLKIFYLLRNKMESLDHLSKLQNLQMLDLRGNKFKVFDQISKDISGSSGSSVPLKLNFMENAIYEVIKPREYECGIRNAPYSEDREKFYMTPPLNLMLKDTQDLMIYFDCGAVCSGGSKADTGRSRQMRFLDYGSRKFYNMEAI
ncbi:hypothetical protein DASC09_054100 [Saccharomycopsis crataegensis]|uniref:L domain-like protein n=1 Tax=Saccharomycopsis crataegensis TaxID=43959 RepID=A0AAV5QU14_9ASCO|nr:hypothetical protein DASC09_054100 [Saccharomycopsis crataegensis]